MIYLFQLNDDNSGSPRILENIIYSFQKSNLPVHLFVSNNSYGNLAKLDIPVTYYWYKKSNYKCFKLIFFLISQISLFYILLIKTKPKNTLFYINAVMPFGAAIYAYVFKIKVVYHIHEYGLRPLLLNSFLFSLVRLTASSAICVSNYLKTRLGYCKFPVHVLHNSLSFNNSQNNCKRTILSHTSFTVLMVCSLNKYKGIFEFIKLSELFIHLKEYNFHLVLNSSMSEIHAFLKNYPVPLNLKFSSCCSDPSLHYENADVLLNLTRKELCIETFGMTIIEAMSFGLPVIVPTKGGPAEIITNGVEGFLIDSLDFECLTKALVMLCNNPELYNEMSHFSFEKSKEFKFNRFQCNLLKIYNKF